MERLSHKKLMLLYIIKNSKIKLTNSNIIDIVTEMDYLNYFICEQYLLELNANSLIVTDNVMNREVYNLTEKGKEVLEYFEKRILLTDKEKALEVLEDEYQYLKRNSQVIAKYSPTEDGRFKVFFKVFENDTPSFSLSFIAETKHLAKKMCQHFKENYNKIYLDTISNFYK